MPRARPTLDEIRTWPATVDLVTAARAFGIGRNLAYELMHSGQFPVRVLPIGRYYRVVVSEVVAVLEPHPTPPPPPVAAACSSPHAA